MPTNPPPKLPPPIPPRAHRARVADYLKAHGRATFDGEAALLMKDSGRGVLEILALSFNRPDRARAGR